MIEDLQQEETLLIPEIANWSALSRLICAALIVGLTTILLLFVGSASQ